MFEQMELDKAQLLKILQENDEPEFYKCTFTSPALRQMAFENAVFDDCKMSNIDFAYSDFNSAIFKIVI